MNIPKDNSQLTVKQVVQLKWLYQEQMRAKAVGLNVRCVVKCKDCDTILRLSAKDAEKYLTKEHPRHNVLIGLHESAKYIPFSDVSGFDPVSGKE